MKRLLGAACAALLLTLASPAAAPASVDEPRIEQLLARLTLEEKIDLLGGDETGFNSRGVARLGIPPIRMADGPVGVRVGTATAWPVSVNLAATWDPALVRRVGEAIAVETLAKGKTCILGPCVGIHRFPLNGRNFESFGEDPHLSGRLAVDYIRGVQSRGVVATVKHFAANDQEWERNNTDSIVDERALREIHLAPFEAAVREGGVWAVMSSYNLVNGQHASENRVLLRDILKGDWGFPGVVMSDWVSVYSTVDAANNGLDIEMPSPEWFGAKLLAAVRAGQVGEAVIDDKVRRHLRVRFALGLFERGSPTPDQSAIETAAHRALAREAAEKGMVLLKNDGTLPLRRDALRKIAVIGPAAAVARTGGGGSSQVKPWVSVSPVEGLRRLLGPGVEIVTAPGVALDSFVAQTIPAQYLRSPDGAAPGLRGEYFNNPKFEGEPVFTRIDPTVDFNYRTGSPDPRIGENNFSIRWTGTFTPPETRLYHLAAGSDDGTRLYLDDQLLVDNWGNHGFVAISGAIRLEAGRAYRVRLDFYEGGGDAQVQLGWKDPHDTTPEPSIAAAVAAARGADLVVLCLGNTANQESEGVDVKDFELPADQAQLAADVMAANPRTVAVLFGGTAQRVKPWVDGVHALVAAFYPGQEGGDALARLLFGEANFSGKLPFSYIQERGESPAFEGYQDPGLAVPYREGVFVGYRWHDAHGVTPLYPFGHGLSYTSFAYSNLRVVRTGDWSCTVTLDVKNTGDRAGDEIVQLYVAPAKPAVVRPVRELKAFQRITLAPGESRTVTLTLDPRAFQYWDAATHTWKADRDTFTIAAGASSRDLRATATVEF